MIKPSNSPSNSNTKVRGYCTNKKDSETVPFREADNPTLENMIMSQKTRIKRNGSGTVD